MREELKVRDPLPEKFTEVFHKQSPLLQSEKQGESLLCKEIGKNLSKSVDKEAGVWYYT